MRGFGGSGESLELEHDAYAANSSRGGEIITIRTFFIVEFAVIDLFDFGFQKSGFVDLCA